MEKNALLQLGLTEKEADIYLLLIRLGASPATTLSRLSRIKRTSMYDVLHGLEKKHLITVFKQKGIAYYVVDDIKKLRQEQQERVSIAENLVETLKRQQGNFEGIHVQYYRGITGYMEMYEDILETNPEELRGWIHLDHFVSAMDPEYEDNWTKTRIKKGMTIRLIMQDTDYAKKYKKDACETRLLSSEKFPFKTTCLMYDDYITFFNPHGDIAGIRIHNPDLAQMQNQMFELSWLNL
jgi:sugar-specific transcriptional regulator TrmB